jgi:hypothetical protein
VAPTSAKDATGAAPVSGCGTSQSSASTGTTAAAATATTAAALMQDSSVAVKAQGHATLAALQTGICHDQVARTTISLTFCKQYAVSGASWERDMTHPSG